MNVFHRGPGDLDGIGYAVQGATHQRYSGAFNGHIGAGANGKTDIGRSQGRSIVDAIAHHGHREALAAHFTDHPGLVFRQHFSPVVVDTRFGSNGSGGGIDIAGDHHHLDAILVKACYRGFGVGFDGIGNSDDTQGLVAQSQEQGGAGFFGDGTGGIGQIVQGQAFAFQPAPVAQAQGLAVKLAFDALAVQGFKAGHFPGLGTGRFCLRQNGFGERVLRVLFQPGRQGQKALLVTIAGMHPGDRGMAFGDGAGLVQNHQVELAGRLQCIALANQRTVFRCLANAHHD